MRQRLVLLEIVAACAALAACGGGGGDSGAANVAAADAPALTTGAAAPDASAPANATVADTPAVASEAALPSPDGTADATVAAADESSADSPAAVPFGGGSMEAVSASYASAEAPSETPASADTSDTAERETAQSLTLDSNDAGYAKPKVAAVDYSTDSSSTRQALLAKFKFVIFGARVGSTAAAFSAGIHSRNSSVKQAYYTSFNELYCSQSSGYYYTLVQAANKANWWLRKADGSRTQWTSLYNTCDMNVTSWGTKDSSGYSWTHRRAQFDYSNAFSKLPYVGYVFSDNTFGLPRVDADWRRIGTNQLRTDSTIISAQRAGQVSYWSYIKGYKSSLKIVGNADNDLSSSQYAEKLNGAFFEGAIGRSWSLETWAGWNTMMKRYRALMANTTSPNDVFLQTYGSSTDYRTMRYGLASALMHNGYFVYLPSSGTLQPRWYDEYDARIGTPLYAPPTAPYPGGDGNYWRRTYSNGIVLVNPSKTKTSYIKVGSGYKRLKGTQDPAVNNGQLQSTVTLGPRQGLIMIRN
jgi:hypothetical protein